MRLMMVYDRVCKSSVLISYELEPAGSTLTIRSLSSSKHEVSTGG